MNGRVGIRSDELAENNHERLNDTEGELIRLRHMIERIGKEKRACAIAPPIMLDVIAAALWVIAFTLLYTVVR